jgi:hypothetical protein
MLFPFFDNPCRGEWTRILLLNGDKKHMLRIYLGNLASPDPGIEGLLVVLSHPESITSSAKGRSETEVGNCFEGERTLDNCRGKSVDMNENGGQVGGDRRRPTIGVGPPARGRKSPPADRKRNR